MSAQEGNHSASKKASTPAGSTVDTSSAAIFTQDAASLGESGGPVEEVHHVCIRPRSNELSGNGSSSRAAVHEAAVLARSRAAL